MNKTTITMLLLATAAAALSLYVWGAFDDTPKTSASFEMTESTTPIIDTISESGASISVTTKTEAIQTPTSNALTKATVSRHATKNDCWVIINNNVYNLTSYLPMHPGGQNAIIEACGGDGTSVFEGVRKHSRANVQAELTSYLLGKLQK